MQEERERRQEERERRQEERERRQEERERRQEERERRHEVIENEIAGGATECNTMACVHTVVHTRCPSKLIKRQNHM